MQNLNPIKQRVVPGVLIDGKFYPSTTPYEKSRSKPIKQSEVQRYFNEREQERRHIQQMTLKKTKTYRENCAACAQLDPDNCLYFDLADHGDESTDSILEDNPFQNRFQRALKKKSIRPRHIHDECECKLTKKYVLECPCVKRIESLETPLPFRKYKAEKELEELKMEQQIESEMDAMRIN